ncbi:MAG: phosphoribosyltransferase family protein [Candidatus Spechtbacterales bacterium]|nr:phosphoribosyltransferase family protein [Candidatus Spechtbacterales bacterium]
MKYKSAYALSECLADIAYSFLLQEEVIEDIILENIVIIPVPSYYKKTKRRGFNPADKIAEHLADYLEATTNIKTLIKIKKTKAQVETRSKKEREENLKNAFSTNKNTDLKKNVVLLVDDVITTGSTMRECSKALKKAGVKEIWGIAIARD